MVIEPLDEDVEDEDRIELVSSSRSTSQLCC